MKRLLTTTTALSMVLSPMGTLPGIAQTVVQVGDQTVVCLADASVACPEGAVCVVAPEAPCGDPAADADAGKAADLAAAEAAAAEAAAAEQAAADAAAADAAAAEQAAADKAAADAAAAEQAAADKAAADAAAAEQAAADKAAADAAAAEQAATDKAAADAAAAEQAAADKAAADAAAANADKAAAEPEVDAPMVEETVVDPAVAEETPASEATPAAEETVEVQPADAGKPLEPTAPELLLAPAEGVEAPKEAAVTSLTDILSEAPDAGVDVKAPEVAAAAAAPEVSVETADSAKVTEVTAEDSRASTEDFATTAAADTGKTAPEVGRKREKLSDLEKFGLVVLGALVVGSVLNNGDKVVANTGDRVVMQRDDGRYVVLKDDDTLIRRPGSTVRTETFDDGSTRSVVAREDGSSIVTIRDASGRVLRRARVDADGRQTLLIDDLAPVERIDVSTLPKPRDGGLVVGTNGNDAALRAALLAVEAGEAGRAFSLRQIREYPQVRALAPTIDVENVTFDSGSAAIDVTEAKKLARLGRLMADLVAENPAELFLIEGHTDAVGSGSSNLALSDRRAESLALALNEYYGVPTENMVIQGYGETELKVDTQGDEVRNRRAAVRMISPLMQKLAGN